MQRIIIHIQFLGSGITAGLGLLKGSEVGVLSGALTGLFTGATVVDIFLSPVRLNRTKKKLFQQ